MTRWSKTVLVALLALTAVPAVAAEPDCAKAETQAALDLCAAKDLKNADRELARIRKQLAKEITDATTRAALDEAQKTWEDYRDAECKFEFERRGRRHRGADGCRAVSDPACENAHPGAEAHPRLQTGRPHLSATQALSGVSLAP